MAAFIQHIRTHLDHAIRRRFQVFKRPLARARQWLRQYLRSIVERDIRDVAQVRNSDELLKLIELLANRTGALLNVTELSTCTGGTRRTVENHLAILERLFFVRCLPSWHCTATKRLVKSPKIHFIDSGLAAMLSGLENGRWLEDRARFGHLLESFVLQQLIAQAGWTDPELRFWHYRDKDQVEVDCVIGLGGAIWAAEIKASRTVAEADTRGLKRLAARAGKDFRNGIVFYAGESILPIAGTPFLAVPVAKLWEQ